MRNRHFFYVALLFSLSAFAAVLVQATQKGRHSTFAGYGPETANPLPMSGNQLAEQTADHNCREWQGEVCKECSLDSILNISVRNKTKTPLLLCRGMKPGPARLVMKAHAEPKISGLWEVEFGLGYQTSARSECPHQFIASNNPPLQTAYEVGPVTVEAEIPSDGIIHILACVGLSSARVGEEGKETGAALRVSELRVISK